MDVGDDEITTGTEDPGELGVDPGEVDFVVGELTDLPVPTGGCVGVGTGVSVGVLGRSAISCRSSSSVTARIAQPSLFSSSSRLRRPETKCSANASHVAVRSASPAR